MSDVLAVRDLTVTFAGRNVVDGVGYDVPAGRTLGVVGESGCGKSMVALAVMGLVPPLGSAGGSVVVEGRDMRREPAAVWRRMRGGRVGMVFQDPMAALNPVMPVGWQIAEAMVLHGLATWREARERAVALLDEMGIADARQRAGAYPHQLSGGMRQRAMIGMAIACRPVLLIADEPTTALDVTIQAQILDLLLALRDQTGMAMQFISHNLAVVSEIADEIIVMYAGRVVERAAAEALFADPLHPYTRGLIATVPKPSRRVDVLPVIPGSVATAAAGCRFADRCARGDASCRAAEPSLEQVAAGHFVACFKPG